MTFLNTWAIAFAGIAPLIVLLYLLKLKRRALPVSTLMFWQRVLQENRRRAFFQKLRQLLSLLLHLLIFALILGALARPTFDRLVREGASTVLIVDTRARMQAVEGSGESRFQAAKKLAAGYARQASVQRQMAILSVNTTTTVAASFTDDEKPLLEALGTLAVTDAGGDLASALQLARDLLASRQGEKQIVVFTDKAPAGRQAGIEYVATGTSQDNVAITRLAARPLFNSPQTSEVLLEMRNFGPDIAVGNVEISHDGRLLDVKPFEIPPGGRKLDIFPSVPRSGSSARGWLTARIDTQDALAADNTAYAVLPATPTRRVLLVSKGNWFLEKLLAADHGLKFELLSPDSFTPALAKKFDVVILDNCATGEIDVRAAATNFLFLRQTPFSAAPEIIEQPLITDLDASHPALRLVSLQNVTVVRAATLARPADGDGWTWQAPIRSFDHPLLITGEKRTPAGARRVAALAFDVAESDLPLRVAFPLLISNTLQWLAGEATETPRAFAAGETILLAADETLWSQPQTKFARDLRPDPAQFARGFFQPLASGFYLLQQPGAAHWIAVNTFSEAESNLRSDSIPSGPPPSLRPISLAALGGWPLWRYLALAAFALFAFEWWLYHRRRTE